MSPLFLKLCVSMFLFAMLDIANAQRMTVIFQEAGFPASDSVAIDDGTLQRGFPGAHFVNAAELGKALDDKVVELLVLPYGSAYPEASWPAILRYLEDGGNLIVLGGKPFTRAAYRADASWQLRGPSVAASLELFIADYQQTPGSSQLRFKPNPDIEPELPPFTWKRGFSPVLRLSTVPLIPAEIGSAGSEDASVTTLAWGVREDFHGVHWLAAPVFLIDHTLHRFVGSRWIFVACDPDAQALSDSTLLSRLQSIALRKRDRFTFRPASPLFLPGERLEFHLELENKAEPLPGDMLSLSLRSEGGPPLQKIVVAANAARSIDLTASFADGKGLHAVDATLIREGAPISTYHSGFWMRDWEYLKSGPKLTVGSDYFRVDGKPLPVVGTTYMGSDVHRLYLTEPNAAIWDRDMAQIHAAGLNMIRSGIWTGWSQLTKPDGTFREETLRTIEAFLMTARHNDLPVQFNLFAFLPDSLGGENAYLDPVALEAQDHYVHSVVERFHDVPFVAWDLINEPSANKNLWRTVPQGDPMEQFAWRKWLSQKYADEAALLAAWHEPTFGVGRALQSKPSGVSPLVTAQDPWALPEAGAFESDAVRAGFNPLKVYDYFLFTQQIFADWAERQRATIRAAGSSQLITVGQDDGGTAGRLSPAFYSQQLDFTSDHSWGDFDSILWTSLAAKISGKPMLIQEMGELRRANQDAHMRFSAAEESRQLERKLALSFAQGAGGIEWVWNVNARMANDNEIPIGAIRLDGTEKPEADVLAGFARFAAEGASHFTEIQAPKVTIVNSQSFQYSAMSGLALAAQRKAIRAASYLDHVPVRLLPENRLSEMDSPQLIILPSPQALTEIAWKKLLAYVEQGGCLLITGPVARDEHWNPVDRMGVLPFQSTLVAIDVRQSMLRLPGDPQALQISYSQQVQQSPIDALRFADGASVEQATYGAGKILWATDPVELSEGIEPTAALYRFAMRVAGVAPSFREIHPLSPGVLAYPTLLKDAILYSFSSESLDDADVDIEDNLTKAPLHFTLLGRRGAVLLLQRSDGKVIASYGANLGETIQGSPISK